MAESSYEAIDQLFRQMNPEMAKTRIDEGLTKSPKDPELLWRLSRALMAAGDRATDKDIQLRMYEKARDVADQAIAVKPDLMMGYLRRAAANGKIALFKGVLETRELVNQTKKDAERALELKNATPYALALAHYLLGRAHLKLAETPKAIRMPLGLAWGNSQDAENHLKQAVATYGESIPFRVDYAKALLKLEKKAAAKVELEKAISLPLQDAGDPERQKEAQDLLKGL